MTTTATLLIMSYLIVGYLFWQAFWLFVDDLYHMVLLWKNEDYVTMVTSSLAFWLYLPFVFLSIQGHNRTFLSIVLILIIGFFGYLFIHNAFVAILGYEFKRDYSNAISVYFAYQKPLITFIFICVWYNVYIEPVSRHFFERM